ncbi:unknown [Bacteroides sp. CAG:1060]|nr:unknown [Bacteroides sp. CAG:1060]
MLVLILVSVGLLVWGSVVGFTTNDGKAVDVLFYWAYVMVGLAVASWVLVGLVLMAKNNPKSLVKVGIVLVVAAALAFVAYLLAPGNPAVGRENVSPADTLATLKLTDTVLNLTYFASAAAVVAIIIGEIRLAIINRK